VWLGLALGEIKVKYGAGLQFLFTLTNIYSLANVMQVIRILKVQIWINVKDGYIYENVLCTV
jgi:hypothetical protein